MALIALAHIFRVGTYLQAPFSTLYSSYFSDIALPFGIYFLLWMNDGIVPFLRDWRVKAVLVFGIASATELLQALGVPLLGQTFDPIDFVMFGVGVGLAVLADRRVFSRLTIS
jgi:hypothetical protein